MGRVDLHFVTISFSASFVNYNDVEVFFLLLLLFVYLFCDLEFKMPFPPHWVKKFCPALPLFRIHNPSKNLIRFPPKSQHS